MLNDFLNLKKLFLFMILFNTFYNFQLLEIFKSIYYITLFKILLREELSK